LLVCTIGGYPASDYIHGRLREVGLHEGQHLVRDRLRRCFTYAASRLEASFSRSTSGAILGPPG
jgi:hypothetical protein